MCVCGLLGGGIYRFGVGNWIGNWINGKGDNTYLELGMDWCLGVSAAATASE